MLLDSAGYASRKPVIGLCSIPLCFMLHRRISITIRTDAVIIWLNTISSISIDISNDTSTILRILLAGVSVSGSNVYKKNSGIANNVLVISIGKYNSITISIGMLYNKCFLYPGILSFLIKSRFYSNLNQILIMSGSYWV